MDEITAFFSAGEHVSQARSGHSLGHPSEEAFIEELTSGPSRDLCPLNMFMYAWDPYQLIESNLKSVYKLGHVMWSQTENSCGSSQVSMVNMVSHYPVTLGLRLGMDVYGCDKHLVTEHLIATLGFVQESYPDFSGAVHLVIYHPTELVLGGEDILGHCIKWETGAYAKYGKQLVIRWKH